MPIQPLNTKLYEQVKKEIYAKYPRHSAYRSGMIVQEYKKRGGTYLGSKTPAKGLARWFAEEWKNQRGEVGYKYAWDVYRPTKRITDETPVTIGELSAKEIEKAQLEKYTKGRIKRFKK